LDIVIPGFGMEIACLLTGCQLRTKPKKWVIALRLACGRKSLSGVRTRRVVPQERHRKSGIQILRSSVFSGVSFVL
jgi:hypothetical protein